jgi:hypothetical protein
MKGSIMKTSLIFCFLLIATSIACAGTYKWEDENGIHLTDNPSSIPSKYQEKALKDYGLNNKATTPPQIEGAPQQQDNSIAEREKQEENNRIKQERARIAAETMRQQQLKNMAQNKLMAQQAFGSISSVVNHGFSIIIRGILMFGISEILFLVIAKFIAKMNNWNVRRAIAIAQLLWLPLAYFIAVQMLTNLGHMNDKNMPNTINSPTS